MNMKELYEKVAGDSGLQARVGEILKHADGQDAAEEELLKFSKELGCEVTMNEAKAFFEGMSVRGELSEEELDMVAGGKANGAMVAMSVFSLGFGCGLGSLITEACASGGCADFFEQ